MSYRHLEAVQLTLFLYGILGVAYFGWGKAFISVAVPAKRGQQRAPATFLIWTGWACTLFMFQLIHFVYPIKLFSVAPILLLGIVLSVGFITRGHRRKTEKMQAGVSTSNHTGTMAALFVLFYLISAWLASRAMLPADAYDSGLYHFNTVRWTNSYPIIPGLGNLHGRLSFNQSFFTYVAALNLHPLFGHGRSIANSFLWVLTLLTLFEVMLPVLGRLRLAGELPPLKWAQALFCVPFLLYWALSSGGISSPSPDLTSCLLQLVMFVIFCRIAAGLAEGNGISLFDCNVLLLLGATAVTVKLSNVAFCGVVMGLALIAFLKKAEKRIVDSIRLIFPAVLVLIVMCLRGFVLSGAPFYPSSVGYVDTQWSVPLDQVINERNWVYSWARSPNMYWGKVLGSWDWFAPWLKRMTEKYTDIMYPVAVFLAILTITFVSRLFWKSKSSKSYCISGLVLVPVFVGLVFWFFTAPDPRVANALFMLLPVSAMLMFLTQIQKQIKKVTLVVIVCILLVVGNLNFLWWVRANRWSVKHVSLDGWHSVKPVPLHLKVTKSGLRVYIPVTGDQCWDSPIPCTPNLKENLRLRDPADMTSGFTTMPIMGPLQSGILIAKEGARKNR